MSYTTHDFTESLLRVGIEPSGIESVVAAWGGGNDDGDGANHGLSENAGTEWFGGFLLKLKDGRHAYVEGWCDYTGWGCQDGAEVVYYEARPALAGLGTMDVAPHDWDEEPADLNRWLATGAKDPYALPDLI